jgi:phosphoribosylglycinamide formyltransferase-1
VTLELGVLVSGTGSNLGAILSAISAGRLDARVRLVVSNKAEAKALDRARAAGVAAAVVSHRDYATRNDYDAAVVRALREAGVEWVMLAGFMRIVTPTFLDAFRDRVLNVHPALLPAFPGVDAQQQALDYGAKVTGCTVHFVDAGVDTGPVVAQAAVPVLEGDDRERLAARILVEEHRLVVEVLAMCAEGRVSLETSPTGRRRVVVRGGERGA